MSCENLRKRRLSQILVVITTLLLGGFNINCSKTANSVSENQSSTEIVRSSSVVASGSGRPAGSAIDDKPSQPQQESPLPPPAGFVNDYAKVIDEKTKKELEAALTKLKERSKIEFAVVTVDTTGEQSSLDYTLAVARGWGVGAKDVGGIILLIAIKDRKWELRWSRKLEDDLKGLVDEMERLITTPFSQGKYSKGITDAVHAVIQKLADRRGFSIQ